MPYTVKFENGQQASFDTQPTAADIEEVAKQLPNGGKAADGGDSFLKSLGEAGLNIGTGMAAGMGGGIGYLGGLAASGGDLETAQKAKESVQDAYTFQPRTQGGREMANKVGQLFDDAGTQAGKLATVLGQNATQDRSKPLTLTGGLKDRGDFAPEVGKDIGDAMMQVAPIHLIPKAGMSILDRFRRPDVPEAPLPPPEAAAQPAPVDPNMAMYQARAEQMARDAQNQPIYVNSQGVADHEISPFPTDEPRPLPELPMDEVPPSATPPSLEPAVEPPRPFPTLSEPDAPPLRALGPDEPLPPPRGETPLPQIPQPDRGLLDFQDNNAPRSTADNTPLPSVEFPSRMDAWNKDPWLQEAAARVEQIAQHPTSEGLAEIQKLSDYAVQRAKEKYGIDSDTARQSLYESGETTGSTPQGPIQKGFSTLSKKQSGSVDPDLLTLGIGPLIDRFKKKAAQAAAVYHLNGAVPEAREISTPKHTVASTLFNKVNPLSDTRVAARAAETARKASITPEAKALSDTVGGIPGIGKTSLLNNLKPMTNAADVIRNAEAGEKDIPKRIAPSLSSGVNNHAIRTGNSTLRFVQQKLFHEGEYPAKNDINRMLAAKDGVGGLLSRMDRGEQARTWEAMMMEDKHNTRYSDEELKKFGFDDKHIDLLKAVRANNERIWSLGGRGDYRAGYVPHSIRGDYVAIARDPETGKTLQIVQGNNAREFQTALEKTQSQFPDAHITDPARKSIKSEQGYGKGVVTVQDLMDILREHGELSNDALGKILEDRNIDNTRNLFNANVHDYNRAHHEIAGWDGNKPWLSPEENAKEGWKSYIATSEQQYFHHYLQDPVNQMKDLFDTLDSKGLQPNAVEAGRGYLAAKTGNAELASSARAVNTLADGIAGFFGYGGKAPVAVVTGARGFSHLWQLGINLKNFAVQLTQPLVQGLPYVKALSKDMSKVDATTGSIKGISRWIQDMVDPKGTDQFTKDMFKYADDNGLRSFAETENAQDAANSKFKRTVDKIGNFLPGTAEKLTRPPMFSVFASMLKEHWDSNPEVFKDAEELFRTAKNATDTVMINYSQNPQVYRKYLGVLGPAAGQFKTYGFGTAGSIRNLWTHDKSAFVGALAALTYVTGLSGLPFAADLDNLVKDVTGMWASKKGGLMMDTQDLFDKYWPQFSKMTGMSSDALFKGGLSQQIGANVQPQFSFSNTIPQVDFQSDKSIPLQLFSNTFPAVNSIGKPAMAIAGAAAHGFTDTGSNMNAAKTALPGQLSSPFTNHFLTTPQGNVINPDTGAYAVHTRTPTERTMADFNLQSNQEVKDKEDTFKATQNSFLQQNLQKATIADLAKKATFGQMDDKTITQAGQTYMKAGGDPNAFVKALEAKIISDHTEGEARAAGIPKTSIATINRYKLYHPTQGQ